MENNVYYFIKGMILSSAFSVFAICNPVIANEQVEDVQNEELAAGEVVNEVATDAQQVEAVTVADVQEEAAAEVQEVSAEAQQLEAVTVADVQQESAAEVQEVSAEAVQVESNPVAEVQEVAAQVDPMSLWQEFHSVPGKCSLSFPAYPEHINEKMSLNEEGYDLIYDAYIASLDKQTVFMLLVAQYPEFVDESYAQMSLEGFLNGILSHNPGNQLIFADLVLVDGHSGLDFFIRTGNVYFKGRAIMVQNNLYLMAMECAIQSYDENHYNHFVNSFQLSQ